MHISVFLLLLLSFGPMLWTSIHLMMRRLLLPLMLRLPPLLLLLQLILLMLSNSKIVDAIVALFTHMNAIHTDLAERIGLVHERVDLIVE